MKGSFARNARLTLAAISLLAVTVMALALQQTHVAVADGVAFQRGDVFAGSGSGKVKHFSPSGTLADTLDTTSASNEETGMCFDGQGNMYVTNWTANSMTKFNNKGILIGHPWGSPFSSHPESCVVDAAGNVYVGESDDSARIFKFDSNGVELATYSPQVEDRGIDWLDLAADQCTIFYTSEGNAVKRFNVCANSQLPDFRSDLDGPCFALRVRLNGEVMVACDNQVYRLSFTGTTIETYEASTYGEQGTLFGQNLDPDGTSFWTGGYTSGRIYRIDIATGGLIDYFDTKPETFLAGLGVFGEITAAQPTPTPGNGTPTPTACPVQFSDVSVGNPFYPFVRCLACRGIISGYSDATFRPGNNITRGQISKMVSSAAAFDEDPNPQVFEDVPPTNQFYVWINRLERRGLMTGYPCGEPAGPCVPPGNRPYFRWNADATRAQLAKIVSNGAAYGDPPGEQFFADVLPSNTFYAFISRLSARGVIGGYPCGGANPVTGEAEPCDAQNRPYFRPNLPVTRGQASKIVANTFLPGCQTP